MPRNLTVSALLPLLLFTPYSQAEASGKNKAPFDERQELALARSAAPQKISEAASIWTLGHDGYERIVEGTNGFNCLVLRKWSAIFDDQRELFDWDGLVAPICYDPVASKGPMLEQFLRAKSGLEGDSHDEIKRAVYEAYVDGKLPTPIAVSFAYMYSSAQKLSPNVGHWHPHLMVYAPYYDNSMLGGNAVSSGDPIVFEAPGTFRAIIAIPVDGREGHISPEMTK